MDMPPVPTEEGYQNCGVYGTLAAEHNWQETSPRGFHLRFLPPTLTLPLEGEGWAWGFVKKAFRHLSNLIHHGSIEDSLRIRQLGLSFSPHESSPKIQEVDACGSGKGTASPGLLRIS
jgi:hypothetical protein